MASQNVAMSIAGSQLPSQTPLQTQQDYSQQAELSLEFLKKFISYARATCAPRLSAKASEKLVNNYVKMRNPGRGDEIRNKSRFCLKLICIRNWKNS